MRRTRTRPHRRPLALRHSLAPRHSAWRSSLAAANANTGEYGLKQIHLRLFGLRHSFSRSFPFGGLRSCAIRLFQVRENFFGAIENFFWQTGEARDVDSVTFVRTAGDNFAQENDLLVPFAHGDVEIADTTAVFGELGQLVVMRGE